MQDNGEIHEVLQGSEGLMVQLMSQRAEGEEWGQWLRAPLLCACEAADADLVDKLLKAGADGRNRGSEGNDRPLLHAAAKGGSDRILLALLHADCKPDIDFRLQDDEEEQGYTALQLVVGKREEKREAARVLVTAGADVTGALIIAIRRGHELVALDLLLAGADPNEGWAPPLLQACKRGYAQLVSALLLKGADPRVTIGLEDTVLHVAAGGGHASTVKALLAGGLPIDIFNTDGQTALHYAVSSKSAGALAVVDMLIAAGADVGAQDDSEPCGARFSPLHVAAQEGHYEAALTLLQHGADVHARLGQHGWHAVHFACRHLHDDVVELLLRWGADETAVSTYGYGGNASETLPTLEHIQAFAGVDAEARSASLAKRERILSLLARAPHDRAWRRRGYITMCRTHPERLRIARGKGTIAGGSRSGPSSTKAARREIAEGRGEEDGGGSGSTGSFDRLAAWLVELPEAYLFRHVVEFL